MNTLHIKKGDTVEILSGTNKGKTGKVLRAFPARGMILVDGVNVVKRHEKARKSGQKGQIIDKHMPIRASKVKIAGAKKSSKKAAK